MDDFEEALTRMVSTSLRHGADISFIIEQLRDNAENNLLTILIFDQFEEFFFVSTSVAQRQLFYNFLRLFLNLPQEQMN